MTARAARKIPVYLAVCSSYDRAVVASLLEEMAGPLGLASSYSGQTVLLKPNLISAAAPALACTDAGFIAGVALWFLEHGARVHIGDSPAFGTAARAMHRHGIAAALHGLAVEPVEFVTPIRRVLPCGCAVDLAAEALDCDLLVNLPKIKAHNQTYVTLAVKNVFGLVIGMRKAILHMREGGRGGRFVEVILDLLDLLPPHLIIADGIVAMHRDGPINGEALALGCVAASGNPIAVDTALLALLELDPSRSPLWRESARRGMAGSSLTDLVYPALPPAAFAGAGFTAPGELNPIRFNPLRFVRGMVRRFVLALRPQL